MIIFSNHSYSTELDVRPLNEIIVHCSATKPEWMNNQTLWAKRMEIDKWHRDRGFNMIGYHLLIDRDGTVTNGRPISQIGAHVAGHNTGTVGVCLIGGYGSDPADQPEQHFTPVQLASLVQELRKLQAAYPALAKSMKITGHNDYANKACPGFKVGKYLDRIGYHTNKGEGTKTGTKENRPASSLITASPAASSTASPAPLSWVQKLLRRIVAIIGAFKR